LLIGDNYSPFLRAAHASNGTIAWTDDRIVYKVSRVRVAPNGEWFVTASEATGAMSIWAKRSNPWDPPPPPPEPVPIVSITAPTPDATYTNFLNMTGTVSPSGSARYVIVSIDNGTAFMAAGADVWSLPVDLRTLSSGYHEVAAWALGPSTVGPTARVGFFSSIQGGPAPGPIELALVAPLNGSTVVQVGALVGSITNATNRTSVFVQVAGRPWVAAERSELEWIANLSPAYNVSGLVQIVISAFDSDGRAAWAEFSVNVASGGIPVPDLEVLIHGPAAGEVVEGDFVVSGATLNGTGPVLTRISLNGSQQAESVLDRAWSVTFSAAGAAAGTHFVWVEAIDAEGRVAFAGRPIVVNHTVGGPELTILFPSNDTEVERSFALVGVCSNCSAGQRLFVFVGLIRVAEVDAAEYWQANVTGLGSAAAVVRVELRDGQTVVARDEVRVQPRPDAAVVQPTEISTLLLVVLVLSASAVAVVAMRRPGRKPAIDDEEVDDPVEPPRGQRAKARSPRRGR
jgi:hypothetical protein